MSGYLAARNADISPITPDGGLMVSLQIDARRALVVGGGPVAAQRVRVLLAAGAAVEVVSPTLNAELNARVARGELRWSPRCVAEADVDGAAIVMVAVDEPEASAVVAGWCRARRIPVNCADKPAICDFHLPAMYRDGQLQIAVATGGAGPGLAARLRDHLASALPSRIGEALRRFGALRGAVRAMAPAPGDAEARMSFLRAVSASWSFDALADLDVAEVSERFPVAPDATVRQPKSPQRVPVAVSSTADVPPVLLVGAGPGDPDLLTVAARRAIEDADVVLCDRLVPDPIRVLVKGELVISEKSSGNADEAQQSFDEVAISAARAGRRVVRLKIGDPGLFGRLGEEMSVYAAHGVAARVVPGVSSALAAPALAGVPLTLRGVADRLWIGTGHAAGDGDVDAPDWQPTTTFVFLMGVGRLGALSSRLQERGFPASLPAMVVQSASTPNERVLTSTLDQIAGHAHAAAIRAPALLVFGHVVAHQVIAGREPVAGEHARDPGSAAA